MYILFLSHSFLSITTKQQGQTRTKQPRIHNSRGQQQPANTQSHQAATNTQQQGQQQPANTQSHQAATNTQQQGQQQPANTQSHQAATNTHSSTTPTPPHQQPPQIPLYLPYNVLLSPFLILYQPHPING